MKELLSENKNFYKANLHCHTTLSDGKWTCQRVKEEYKKRGYSVVAFTDHEYLFNHKDLDDENFLTINSYEVAFKQIPEVTSSQRHEMKVAHMNFYSTSQDNDYTPVLSELYAERYKTPEKLAIIKSRKKVNYVPYCAKDINEAIKYAKDHGFLVSYNHPNWSNENAFDYLNYEGVDFVEIYNNACVHQLGINDDEHMFDEFLRAGKKVFCTATDDNHAKYDIDSPRNDSFGGWVQINANALTYDDIISALKEGNFYASTGPEIYSLYQDGDVLKIKTSNAKRITLTTNGRAAQNLLANFDEYLTKGEFEIKPEYKYIRITVEDEFGKRAYTQAYEIEL